MFAFMYILTSLTLSYHAHNTLTLCPVTLVFSFWHWEKKLHENMASPRYQKIMFIYFTSL